jgi:hypothetical protein
VCQNAEARQSGSESTADSVRDREIEGSHPPLAKPDQKDGSQQNCQKEDNARGDQHVQLPL